MRKSEASHICLMYDTQGLQYPVPPDPVGGMNARIRHFDELCTGFGYVCPNPSTEFQEPMGLKSWPCVFVFPPVRQLCRSVALLSE